LLNGMTFQSTFADGDWETRVTSLPNDGSGDLEVGDIVLALVSTTSFLTERTALAEVLEREMSAGSKDLSFAVTRDGSTWVASMFYDDSLYAADN